MALNSRDGGIRTRGLLLPNQFCPDAGRGATLLNVCSTWDDTRCTWPDPAPCLCMLAPTLAPTAKAIRCAAFQVALVPPTVSHSIASAFR